MANEVKKECFDDYLDKFEQTIGVTQRQWNGEADKYFNMPESLLEKLTPHECSVAAVLLCQYGFYMQKVFNKEQGRLNAFNSQLRRYIADKLRNAGGPTFEERMQNAINQDDYAQGIQKNIIATQGKLDRLNYLSAKIQMLSSAMDSLAQRKVK